MNAPGKGAIARWGAATAAGQSVVVLVDDDAAARHSLAQMLKLRGHAVEVFSSAEAALAWPGFAEAACVITDMKMPGMDGEQLLAEARRRPSPPPVVMITGHGDVSMAVRCLKAGAFDFVEKPFDDDLLLAYVAKALEQSSLLREAGELRQRLALLPRRMAPSVWSGAAGVCRTCTNRSKGPPAAAAPQGPSCR